jgi:SAM-dependent methyltransferase
VKEIDETYDADFVLPALYEHVAGLFGQAGATLEVPCSSGTGLLKLAEFCSTVTGVDFSAEHIGRARNRIAGRDDIEVDIGDLADLDRARTYDLVLVPREGFQFISPLRDARSIVDSLARVVRPGGHLILDCFDFLGAQIWSPTDTPRYFRATQDAPTSVTEVVLRPASGRLLRRRTVAESIKEDPIEFASIYALEDGYTVHRNFLMAQYAGKLLQAYGHAASLIPEAVNRGYGLTGTPNARDTGRRVVVFRRASYGLLR